MDDDEGDGTRNDNVAKEWKSVRMASDRVCFLAARRMKGARIC
jgi:hypothetical protein